MNNLMQLGVRLFTGEFTATRALNRQVADLRKRHLRENRVYQKNQDFAQQMKFFAGANPGTRRPMPRPLNSTDDFKYAYERIIMIRCGRQLEEDFSCVDNLIEDMVTYGIGELKYLPGTGNPDADADIRDFLEWQFDQCDYSGQQDLEGLLSLGVRTEYREGEYGFRDTNEDGCTKLAAYSADRIGDPVTGANIGPDNFNGIIVDPKTQAPIFYDLYRKLAKMNAYVFEERVVAEDFLHGYDPFRYEQKHGITALKNCIETCYDLKEIYDYVRLNMKYRSNQLPVVMNEQGRPRGSGYEDIAPNPITQVAQPMEIMVDGNVVQQFMKLGEGVVEFPNDFPNQQFLPATEEFRRDMTSSFKIPYEFAFRSQSGGVVQRFYVEKAKQTFKKIQRRVKRQCANPIKNRMIQRGIDYGYLDLSKYGTLAEDAARFRGVWQMGSNISVDYGKDSKADIALIQAGLKSEEEYVAENGGSLRDVTAKKKAYVQVLLKDVKEVAEEFDVPFDIVLPLFNKIFPNAISEAKAAAASPDPSQVDKDPESEDEDDPTNAG